MFDLSREIQKQFGGGVGWGGGGGGWGGVGGGGWVGGGFLINDVPK